MRTGLWIFDNEVDSTIKALKSIKPVGRKRPGAIEYIILKLEDEKICQKIQ